MTGAERFTSDAKDYDITGAKYVNGDGNDIISMLMIWQGFVLGIDTGRLMGDPNSKNGWNLCCLGIVWEITLSLGRALGKDRMKRYGRWFDVVLVATTVGG